MSPTGCVVWLTGLSAAGKTTIAKALELKLSANGVPTRRIDGDELRRTVCADLGFSAADRAENVRRAARLAAESAERGKVCIVALISPLQVHRDDARQIIGTHRFIEVHVATPLEVCRKRDPKGLYARADRGELREFTGISAPYEPPLRPELALHTETIGVGECVDRILARVSGKSRHSRSSSPDMHAAS